MEDQEKDRNKDCNVKPQKKERKRRRFGKIRFKELNFGDENMENALRQIMRVTRTSNPTESPLQPSSKTGNVLTREEFRIEVLKNPKSTPEEITMENRTDEYIVFPCPHCREEVCSKRTFSGVGCGIFRHGIYKKSYMQIPPHTSQEECEKLIKSGEIFGCGKPFRVFRVCDVSEKDENKRIDYYVKKCNYI